MRTASREELDLPGCCMAKLLWAGLPLWRNEKEGEAQGLLGALMVRCHSALPGGSSEILVKESCDNWLGEINSPSMGTFLGPPVGGHTSLPEAGRTEAPRAGRAPLFSVSCSPAVC